MATVRKFIEYRRAIWIVPGQDLETLVREACRSLATTTERVVKRRDDVCVMALSVPDYDEDGIGLHCVKFVEQQGVGVVPMREQINAVISERRPGNEENFLDSDFFLLISGDHVLSMNAGMNCASARQYLYGLFEAADLGEDSTKFDIMRVGNVDGLRKIDAAGGVASVQMDLSLQEATVRLLEDEAPRRWSIDDLTRPAAGLIQALCSSDQKASTIGESQKGNLRLSISVPSGDLVAAKEGLNGIGEIILNDEEAEDYVIHLRNEETIRPGELAVKKPVRLEREANTVRAVDVFQEMQAYLVELRGIGQLEV